MKNRIELIRLFANLGFIKGAEIGVASGRFSELMLKTIPGLKLICVDDYSHPKFAHFYDEANTGLAKYYPQVKLIRKTSMEAIKLVHDEFLDFVYIDADHEYTHVRDDIREWTKKVRIGGVVSGDDYYLTRHGNYGVIRAVNEYCDANGYILHTTNWDLTQEVEDDQQPNWYFIK